MYILEVELLIKLRLFFHSYWKDLVDWTTITVNLTPIGAHQNVIVKRIDEEKVYLQAHGGMPINCFYHIYGTRADGERLIPEYEGETPADYPGEELCFWIPLRQERLTMAGEFIENNIPPRKDCGQYPADWGQASTLYHHIWKGNANEDEYPEDACAPYYHQQHRLKVFK